MRTFLIMIILLPGCGRTPDVIQPGGRERTARIFAALVETAANNAHAGLDSTRARAAADSVLKSESVTREEFLADVRELNRNVTAWREVSEGAARILEQRLAARGAGH